MSHVLAFFDRLIDRLLGPVARAAILMTEDDVRLLLEP